MASVNKNSEESQGKQNTAKVMLQTDTHRRSGLLRAPAMFFQLSDSIYTKFHFRYDSFLVLCLLFNALPYFCIPAGF
jgi:hypothetical protein